MISPQVRANTIENYRRMFKARNGFAAVSPDREVWAWRQEFSGMESSEDTDDAVLDCMLDAHVAHVHPLETILRD